MENQNRPKSKMNLEKTYSNDTNYFGKLIIKIVLLIVLIFPSVFFIRASLTANSILSYTEKGIVDYKVYLKENNFYKDRYLGKNMTYITSLVDYIDIDFNYNFNTSEKAKLDYTYSIYANLIITPEDNSKVLFDEKYILSDDITKQLSNGKNYNIAKTLNLDYNFYNDLANTFKTTYGVNCNSKLVVGLLVNTQGKDIKYEREFNNSNEMKVVFSLTKKQVDINLDAANINNKENMTVTSEGTIKNIGFLIVGLVFASVAILDGISIARTLYKRTADKDDYTRYIEKILNNYDRAIVETHYMPNLEEYEVIEVGRFSELLDVRDTLRLPILYTPTEEGSCFYIRHNDTIYIHYVSCTSLVPVKKLDNLFM